MLTNRARTSMMKGERKAAFFFFFNILIKLPISLLYFKSFIILPCYYIWVCIFVALFLSALTTHNSDIIRLHLHSQSYAGVRGDFTVTLSSPQMSANTHFIHWRRLLGLISCSRTLSDMYKDQWLFYHLSDHSSSSSVQQLLFLCVTVDKGQRSYLLGQVYSKVRCEGIFSEQHNDVCMWYRNPARFRDLHGLML